MPRPSAVPMPGCQGHQRSQCQGAKAASSPQCRDAEAASSPSASHVGGGHARLMQAHHLRAHTVTVLWGGQGRQCMLEAECWFGWRGRSSYQPPHPRINQHLDHLL